MGRIIKKTNRINENEAKLIIDFMDSNLDKFAFNDERKRHMLRFGYDDEYPELEVTDFSIIDPIKDILIKLFDMSKQEIEDSFGDPSAKLCSFFISKHGPGGAMRSHVDSQDRDGQNPHLDYTVMIYLNTMKDSGAITFPILDKTIMPVLGDLVIFESKDMTNTHKVEPIGEDRYSVAIWFTKSDKHLINFK